MCGKQAPLVLRIEHPPRESRFADQFSAALQGWHARHGGGGGLKTRGFTNNSSALKYLSIARTLCVCCCAL
ncbi:uncharacterized protein H6S33_010218 [Morchella sextelata]|uniref:uncharacterized protein n=1 Tax=Morchella sextelata TaxID=1174677 RepID=UPI001D05AF88|nr:uncharacterized protein H6S33_010218 [Morchella sextelata]KAH0612166.1 hypothetical protein H6S33_010218 [Morchella sextelata]